MRFAPGSVVIRAPGAAVDPRTACLVALLGACRLLGTVTDGVTERRRASARAKSAMAHEPAARAVKAIADEVHATTAAAVATMFGA